MSKTNIDHSIDRRVVAGTSSRSQDVLNPAIGAVTGYAALANAAGFVMPTAK